MRARATSIRAGSKARGVHDAAHVCWRAGAIRSWLYGRRSPSDPKIVWMVDDVEYERDDLSGVSAVLETALARAGIASASFGTSWCGYRSLRIEYLDGSCLIERYDGALGRVVREHVATEVAA